MKEDTEVKISSTYQGIIGNSELLRKESRRHYEVAFEPSVATLTTVISRVQWMHVASDLVTNYTPAAHIQVPADEESKSHRSGAQVKRAV